MSDTSARGAAVFGAVAGLVVLSPLAFTGSATRRPAALAVGAAMLLVWVAHVRRVVSPSPDQQISFGDWSRRRRIRHVAVAVGGSVAAQLVLEQFLPAWVSEALVVALLGACAAYVALTVVELALGRANAGDWA